MASDVRFVPNREFYIRLDRAIDRALTDKARRIENRARSYTKHPSVARTIRYEKARRDAAGISATVGLRGRSLGHIFEGGAKDRRLKGTGKYPAGTYRGSIEAERFMQRAVAQEKSIPLNIRL